MNRKRIVWGSSIAALVLVIIYLAAKYVPKVVNSGKLKIGTSGSPSFTNLSLVNILSGSLILQVKLNLQNFSNSVFKVNQIAIDAFTQGDVAIATQRNPLPEPLQVLPNQDNIFPIQYNFSYTGLANMIKGSGLLNKNMKLITFLNEFVVTGKLGINLKLKGF